ncbi:MAG: 3-mercaptopyruvate sulfurtransferase [Rhodobacteraceae bacterium]|nr:3-mercaptopyruvate sulfurtransferase [Paracoccaceae bacterium]
MATAKAIEGGTLVSAKWLQDHLAAPDVRVLDGSWHLPTTGRDAKAEFLERHIPGSAFFDIDDISNEHSALPHMFPPMEKFVSRIRKLGVGDGHRIIVYDTAGLHSAARVWLMFRYFGHKDIAVLDGGLPAWLEAGYQVEDMPATPRERHFTPRIQSMLVKDVTQVSAALKLETAQLVDARSPGRFRGEEPEPRPGLQAGHMPGAINVHYQSLLRDNGAMKSAEELRAVFQAADVDLSKPIITSCGSGVSAAIVNLALERLGHRDHSMYDGSWAEWGSSPMLAVAMGS